MASITLENTSLRLTILPAMGGGLTSFDARVHGADWQPIFRRSNPNPSDPNELAFYPLLPWSNRVNPEFVWAAQRYQLARNRDSEALPIHGDAWLSAWTTETHCENAVTLVLSAHSMPAYHYAARLRYELTEDALHIGLEVTHLGQQAMIYGLGFHPWIHRTTDTVLSACHESRWIEDPHTRLPVRRLPAGEPHLNLLPADEINAVFEGWCSQARVEWPASELGMTVSASSCLNYFVLYSTGAEANFFCFEPVSHMINAHAQAEPLQHGLKELQPGETLKCRSSFQIHGLRTVG